MLASLSIRTRLAFYHSLTVALLLGVCAVALLGVVSLNRLTDSLDQKWVAGTRMLGEAADLISKIRADDLQLALASGEAEIAAALANTARHERELAAQRSAYAELPKTVEEKGLFEAFGRLADSWEAEHRAWSALPADARKAASAAFQGKASSLYLQADQAIVALIDANTRGASAAGERARVIAGRSALIFWLFIGAALVLEGTLFMVIRSQITRPLASITEALSALAGGDRDVAMPESRRHDEIGKLAQAFEVFRAAAFTLEDAHRAAEASQLRAQALARHDMLTGLANRRVLFDELNKAIARTADGSASFAVLLLDLDQFKPVNDIYGHSAGDMVLVEITTRLKGALLTDDTLARIGGDEFVIILDLQGNGEKLREEAILLAERILKAISDPVVVGESQVEVGVSIGIALWPGDGNDAETILHAADMAMYRAKAAGRGTFRFYEADMDAELQARTRLESAVRQAVTDGAIEPYYQPLIEIATGRVIGFEILARWTDVENGPISPDTFIPTIEHLGLMSRFTTDMLRRACIAARRWPNHLTLSLNVSPSELRDALFPTRLLAVLSETGFSPRRLEIEITESALLADLDTARDILLTLRSIGIKVALDDFGTGYSSLCHLRELSLDRIKIDRSFVQSMNEDPESAKIVHAILGLAKSLHLPTTAEGVEDTDVMAGLGGAGCEIGQGYLFGKAIPADMVMNWIEDQTEQQGAAKIA
ncbi:putative bifunctional diguanylate cyclase/phosphodiesterase [Hansschlegelia quercus]|nr:EAL domain-containing protein [Hansschlegelia quercus]